MGPEPLLLCPQQPNIWSHFEAMHPVHNLNPYFRGFLIVSSRVFVFQVVYSFEVFGIEFRMQLLLFQCLLHVPSISSPLIWWSWYLVDHTFIQLLYEL
jgi:hypothetical protein